MALMEWNDRFSVGVESIDGQHKELVRMLNELSDAMMSGKGQDQLKKVVSDLIAYTASHFAHEERLMDRYSYPEAATHKKIHADLVQQALEIKKKVDAGTAGSLTFEVLGFLKNWLVNHIQGTDKKLGQFINEAEKKAHA